MSVKLFSTDDFGRGINGGIKLALPEGVMPHFTLAINGQSTSTSRLVTVEERPDVQRKIGKGWSGNRISE